MHPILPDFEIDIRLERFVSVDLCLITRPREAILQDTA